MRLVFQPAYGTGAVACVRGTPALKLTSQTSLTDVEANLTKVVASQPYRCHGRSASSRQTFMVTVKKDIAIAFSSGLTLIG